MVAAGLHDRTAAQPAAFTPDSLRLHPDSPGAPGAAADSLAADSLAGDSLVAEGLPEVRGLMISDLGWDGRHLWVCGDSGLVARSLDDSLWYRYDPPDSLALTCLAFAGRSGNRVGRFFCAGDSGRVFIAEGEELRRIDLRDRRRVLDLGFADGEGLLCGDLGLVARSFDAGLSWEILEAPLPMRFRCLLLQSGRWWIGGAGGFLYYSDDRGSSWARRERDDFTPLVSIREDGRSITVALADGRIERLTGGKTWEELCRTPWLDAEFLQPWPSAESPRGWLAGGSGGRLYWHPIHAGDDLPDGRALRLDAYSSICCSGLREGDVLLGGAWGLLANFDPAVEEQPERIRHDLFGLREQIPEEAEQVAEEDSLAVSQVPDSLLAEDQGPRILFNLLDTEPRPNDPPTRLRQLVQSYNRAGMLQVPGFAVLMLDLDSRGRITRHEILDEYPLNLGYGGYAVEVTRSLTFKPAFLEGQMVPSRILYRVHFPLKRDRREPWFVDEGELPPLLDSLIRLNPRPFSRHAAKAMTKKMGFPRKAKRHFWNAEAVVQYDLHPGDSIGARKALWETPAEFQVGEHALEVLDKLDIGLPDSLRLGENQLLRVIQRMRFDRKKYKRAAKEIRKGFRFQEVLFSVVLVDSSRYIEGLRDLALVAEDFLGSSTGNSEVELELHMAGDGRLLNALPAVAEGAEDGIDEQALETLRSLAVFFSWGHPEKADDADDLDTLRVRFDPRPPDPGKSRIEPLFQDVLY